MSKHDEIPDTAVEAVQIYACVTHGYVTRVRDELIRHVDNHAGCKMRIEEDRRS